MSYIKHKSEESMEDYLETILLLQKKNGNVRSIDIANELGFTKASVSVAMKSLREKDYISVAETGYITLTQTGQKRAENVYERHTILSDCLIRLGVSKEIAMEDACRIEHDISEETFQALKKAILQE
ncbi:MAG: metal-dependent transcriptional regulator [Lachnospiraceae bacterium]|nr:metal-dependent transcriptional regulator [Lachnospiraceae bacterium]